MHTTFQMGRMQSCCYLAPKKKIISLRVHMTFRTFINYFMELLLHFSYTIPHEGVFIDFIYFLGIVNLRNNPLLVRTISIACMIPCQRIFAPNLIFTGVVLGRSLWENRCSGYFYKNWTCINKGLTD